MAPHSSTFAWKIPWMEEPGRLGSMGSLGSDTTEWLHFHFSLSCIGEGNGNPLQCSCLENPRDGAAWWAAVCGVAQSRTQLKQLSSSSRKRNREQNTNNKPPSLQLAWYLEVQKFMRFPFIIFIKFPRDIYILHQNVMTSPYDLTQSSRSYCRSHFANS